MTLALKQAALRVFVEPDGCWESEVGEDSVGPVCQLCVDICPEVFEKPSADRCARARVGVDPGAFEDRVRHASACCPIDAILIYTRDRFVSDGRS